MSDSEGDADDVLDKFLAKVDEVGNLVKDLATSQDEAASFKAIEMADEYIHQLASNGKETKTACDRMLINTTLSAKEVDGGKAERETAGFCRTIEQDAKERAERKKEKEARGKEMKRKGCVCFKCGKYEEALEHFTAALREMPWDLALYTNRALTYNRMFLYKEALEECDSVIQMEPSAVKAYIHKASALRGLAESRKAEECLLLALKLCPDRKEDLMTCLESWPNNPDQLSSP